MEVEAARRIFKHLFENVDGFSTSMNNRKRLDLQNRELTYGEITFSAIRTILEHVNPQPHEVFYDLGSGVGKPVIAAALLYQWKKLIGVEILEDVYQEAEIIRKQFLKMIQPEVPPISPIEFVNADINLYDFSDGDVVYIASTCFDLDFMQTFSKRCAALKPGSRIITLTKELYDPSLEHKHKLLLNMSWGDSTVHIYERTR